MDGKKELKRFKTFGLGLLAFLFYLLIIIYLQTKPASDFEHYYETALRLTSGEVLENSHKYFQAPGYPYILKIFFKFFKSKSIFIPQIFNALVLTFLSLLLTSYSLVESLNLKLIGFFVLAFNLNHLAMVSILCSEIPYGLFFTGGIFLIWLAFKKVGSNHARMTIRMTFLSSFAGTIFAISQSIRPTTTPFLLLLSIMFFLSLNYFTICLSD